MKEVPRRLNAYELWSNKTYHETIHDGPQWIPYPLNHTYNGSSPYDIVFDRHPPSVPSNSYDPPTEEYVPHRVPRRNSPRRGTEPSSISESATKKGHEEDHNRKGLRLPSIPESNSIPESSPTRPHPQNNSRPLIANPQQTSKDLKDDGCVTKTGLQYIRSDIPIPRKAPMEAGSSKIADRHGEGCFTEIDLKSIRSDMPIPRRARREAGSRSIPDESRGMKRSLVEVVRPVESPKKRQCFTATTPNPPALNTWSQKYGNGKYNSGEVQLPRPLHHDEIFRRMSHEVSESAKRRRQELGGKGYPVPANEKKAHRHEQGERREVLCRLRLRPARSDSKSADERKAHGSAQGVSRKVLCRLRLRPPRNGNEHTNIEKTYSKSRE